MKKVLVVLIGVMMAVMFAAESYAAVEVGGTIDVRGRLRENNNDVNKDYYGSTAFWQEKVNIWVDAKIAEGLRGYIELQTGGATSSKGWMNWGTSRSGTCGGTTAISTTACTTTASTDAASSSLLNENRGLAFMEVRYAYIDFMIPSTPVGIKIGHQPFILGHSIWANTGIWGSDGLVLYAVPIKELMIGLGALKGYETASNTDRTDADLYVFMVNYTFIPKNTVGFNASYILRTGNSGDNGKVVGNTYWNALAGTGTSPDGSGVLLAINDMKFWNIMLTVDGALDFGLMYKFEIDKQFGKIDDTAVAGVADLKGSGLALLVGAGYKIADIAKVDLDIAYGSGDKCTTWGAAWAGATNEQAPCSATGDKFEGYLNFNDYAYTMVYEDIVGQKRGVSTLTSTDFGLYNTMYAKVGAGVTPLKDMSIDLGIFYLRAVKEKYYNQNKNIGFEADLTFGYNIYKNLKWTFMAGYLMAGKHYKAINAADRVDDGSAYAFEQKLSLKF